MRRFLVALALTAAASPAIAGADGDLLAKHGYLGQWAYDCGQPPSANNPHFVAEAPASGPPTERLLTGGAYDRLHQITDVRELPDGRLQWIQISDQRLTLVKVIEKDRARTWSSVGADGTVFIKDGRFASGSEVRWFYRCGARAAQ